MEVGAAENPNAAHEWVFSLEDDDSDDSDNNNDNDNDDDVGSEHGSAASGDRHDEAERQRFKQPVQEL